MLIFHKVHHAVDIPVYHCTGIMWLPQILNSCYVSCIYALNVCVSGKCSVSIFINSRIYQKIPFKTLRTKKRTKHGYVH